MTKQIITTIAILVLLSSCKKDELKPRDYQFYCKVDGVEWKRTKQNEFCPECTIVLSEYYPKGSILKAPGAFIFKAYRNIGSKGIRQHIDIYIKRLKNKGQQIHNVSRRNIFTDHKDSCVSIEGHALDTNFTNSLVVTNLDTINKSIRGTFDFRVVNHHCVPPDTIRITEGHFDLNPAWHY